MLRLIWMLAAIAASAGCRQLLGLDDLVVTGDAGGDPDGRDGEVPDGPLVACTDWIVASGHFSPCDIPPGEPLDLAVAGTYVYDTDTRELTDPAGGKTMPTSFVVEQKLLILSTESFTIEAGANLRIVGSLPLAIASWGVTRISGTLNAASIRTTSGVELGAGANSATCDVAEPGQGTSDAGGGGGGGFGGKGGEGGNGKSGQNTGGQGGSGLPTPQAIHGGCPGGNGGIATSAGKGGAGGGAIEIASPVSISVDGVIHVGGAGGGGAIGDVGGGGGGSGGYVGIDAPAVTVSPGGIIAANGGGGGAGCANASGANGTNGAANGQPAVGGNGASCQMGTDGGSGGAAAQDTGGNGMTGGNGGGGGGGVGYVLVWASTWSHQGLVSPAAKEL